MKAVQKVMSQASSAVLQENNTEEVQPVSGEVTEASNEGDVKKQEETPPSEKDASDPEIKQEEEKADDIVQEQESTEGEGDSSEGVYVVEQGGYTGDHQQKGLRRCFACRFYLSDERNYGWKFDLCRSEIAITIK